MSVVGFVVAGGQSHRMGRDKALLPWGATDLLDHALARLREVADDVRVLGGAEPRYVERGAPVEADLVPGLGPLGGVFTGLAAARGRAGLFLAVDLPHVSVPLLARLLERAEGWDAVVPVPPRGPEPLCAVYGPRCLEPIRARIAAGDLRMTAFWPEVRVRKLGAAELESFGNADVIFRNLNTPEDLRDPAV